jgi:hypothetical protein
MTRSSMRPREADRIAKFLPIPQLYSTQFAYCYFSVRKAMNAERSCPSRILEFGGGFVIPSVITAKAANSYQFKTGHSTSVRDKSFYSFGVGSGKDVLILRVSKFVSSRRACGKCGKRFVLSKQLWESLSKSWRRPPNPIPIAAALSTGLCIRREGLSGFAGKVEKNPGQDRL